MRLKVRPWIWALALPLLIIGSTFVYAAGDLWLSSDTITLSDNSIVHNQTVRIYATIHNSSSSDHLGTVRFINKSTGEQIGSDQAISALSENTDTVFVDWTPTAGTYEISVTVYPWNFDADDPNNNSTIFVKTVDYDFDGDGVGNAQDPDDDNDEVNDDEDAFPLNKDEWEDTDNDGIGNNEDLDDDDDGVLDEDDAFPSDPTEWEDTDNDGTGNNADEDDDNDGLTDEEEASGSTGGGGGSSSTNSSEGEIILSSTNDSGGGSVTDPLNPDTDGDSVNDGQDVFPNDETEWADSDNDGIGNNADPNDDNDDLADIEDDYPENHGPVVVFSQYQTTNEEGDQEIVLSALESYDPDGDDEKMIFRWFSQDGRLIGETAEYRTTISPDMLLPSTLKVFDENGEWREVIVNFTQNKLVRAIGMTISFIILFVLAILILMKYTSSASKKSSKKGKKS